MHYDRLSRVENVVRPYDALLRYYGNERFLYRLSRSPFNNLFILKGALTLYAFMLLEGRATRDIYMRFFGENDVEKVKEIVRNVCMQKVEPDGVYSLETVVAEKLHAMVVLGDINSRMKNFYRYYAGN